MSPVVSAFSMVAVVASVGDTRLKTAAAVVLVERCLLNAPSTDC